MSVNFNNSVDGGIARFHGTAGGAVSGAPANDTPCNIDESSISDTQLIFLGRVWEGGNGTFPLQNISIRSNKWINVWRQKAGFFLFF